MGRRLFVVGVLIACIVGLIVAPALSPRAVAAGETVSIWVTTGDQSKLLQQQANVNFGPDSGSNPTTIDVNEATTYQTMDGFGASFTDSSAWLVWNRLSASQRTTLMNNLFNPTTGIGLSYLRQPMGSSDFALSNYTYDDSCCDVNNFSISHDSAYIIPVLQQARQINPNIKIMGSPWSAPAWMKTNNSLITGKLNTAYYSQYADYFVKYVQAYGAQGLPIDAITVQNEPLFEPGGYPGMRMEANEQADFVKNHLGPKFQAAGITTKIIVYDHNWDQPNYPITVLNDAAARNYIAGSAFHCYAGQVSAQQQVQSAYPSKGLWFTECSGGNWAPNFADNLKWDMQNLVIGSTRNWAKSVVKWNMALDTNHGPTNGGCTDCRGVVTINQSNGAVTYEVEYYALGHASKFVVPGAVRIASNNYAGGIENVAFRNPDGSKVLVVVNMGTAANTFKVRWAGQSFSYTLPAGAAATFKWSSTGTPPPTTPPPTTPPPTTPPPAGQQPYSGTPYAIPGTIQAENYDRGGEGVAFHDTDTANTGGQYRTTEGVDIETTTDTGGGYNVGWTRTDEWIEYTVNVATAGNYTLTERVASAATTGSFRIEFNGVNKTGTVTVPNTGGWQTYTNLSQTVNLSAGQQVMRIYFQGNDANFNHFIFTSTGTPPPTTPPPTTPPPTTPPPTTPPPTGTYYRITSRESGKSLDIAGSSTADGAVVQQWTYGGGLNQQFRFVAIAGTSYFQIIARHSGKCLDVSGVSTADGANIDQWTCTAANQNQHFLWQAVSGTSFFRIVARHSGKCLDVRDHSLADGGRIQQWTCGTGLNQQWSRVQVP